MFVPLIHSFVSWQNVAKNAANQVQGILTLSSSSPLLYQEEEDLTIPLLVW